MILLILISSIIITGETCVSKRCPLGQFYNDTTSSCVESCFPNYGNRATGTCVEGNACMYICAANNLCMMFMCLILGGCIMFPSNIIIICYV